MKNYTLFFLFLIISIYQINAQSIGVYNNGNDLNIGEPTGGTTLLYVKENGNIGIGTNSPRLILEINDSTGIIIPAGTTVQRPTGIEGMIRFNIDTKMLEVYNNTTWEALTSIGVFNDTDGDTKVDVESLADEDFIRFFTRNTEAMFIDTLGYIGMGVDSAFVKLHIASSDSNAAIAISAANNLTDEFASLYLTRARGTLTGPTAVQTSDVLGAVVFVGYDGNGYEGATAIHAEAAQSFTPTQRGTRMVFSTTPIDSTDEKTAMMIDHDGTVAIGLDDPWDSAHFHLETENVIGGYFENGGTTNLVNFGLVGEASKASNKNIGIFGVGIADQSADTAYGVFGQVNMNENHIGVGVTGFVQSKDPGIAVGIHGISGQNDGGTTGKFYGGIFDAKGGGQDTTYGALVSASGGSRNYAIYSVTGTNVLIDSVAVGHDSAKAILDVESTESGILIPRMLSAQRTAITNLHEGLLVYDIDDTAFYYYGNNAWQRIVSTNVVGDALEDGDGDTHIETEQNSDEDIIRCYTADSMHMLIDNFGNVGVGIDFPQGKFHVSVDQNAIKDSSFIVNSLGHVGIGTTLPQENLEIESSSSVATMSLDHALSDQFNNIYFKESGVYKGSIGQYGSGFTTPTFQNDLTIANLTSAGAAGDIQFIVNNGITTPSMTLTSGGNLGIGVTTPSEKFVVQLGAGENGNSVIGARNDGGTLVHDLFVNGSGNGVYSLLNNAGSAQVQLHSSGNSYFLAGNIGIGTQSPNELLQINVSNTGSAATLFTNSNTGASSTDGLWVGYSGSSAAIWNYENTYLEFATNNQSRMAIKNDGNVGIGLTSPSELFHISDAGNTRVLLEADNDNSNEFDHPQIIFSQDGGATTGLIGYSGGTNDMTISNDISADINFETNGGIRMTIDNFGNVGVGTTSPTGNLHLNSFSTNTYFQLTTSSSSGGSSSGLRLFAQGTTGYLTNYENAQLRLGTNGGTNMTIKNDGNIGIGTTSPSEKLEVVGAVVREGFFQASMTGTLTITTSKVTVPFNIQNRVDGSYYSHNTGVNNDEIIIQTTGWYRISYTMNYNYIGGTNRFVGESTILKNASVTLNNSKSIAYVRGTGGHLRGSSAATFITNLNAGDRISVEVFNASGLTANVQLVPNQCWILIEKI